MQWLNVSKYADFVTSSREGRQFRIITSSLTNNWKASDQGGKGKTVRYDRLAMHSEQPYDGGEITV
jgi:hypothetical protein